MTAILRDVAHPAGSGAADGFEISHSSEDGVELRTPLANAWALPFEAGLPVRRFTARKGQEHLSGLWWSATMRRHVGFESWLERDHVMLLDFDPSVVGIASQPFWLYWRDEETGKPVSHAPDFFARRADGSAVVMDCRPVERRPLRDMAKFAATEEASALVGWEYRLVGATDPIETANVRWLAGYRHPRHLVLAVAQRLREVFASATPLFAGAQDVSDPIAVLPVLFHLLWSRELDADLSTPLHQATLARVAAARRRSHGWRGCGPGTRCTSMVPSIRWSRWPAPRSGCARTKASSRLCWERI